MNDNAKAVKSGAWYIVINFFSKGLAFITTPIFTRLLSVTEYGDYSNFATWLSLLLVITTFELFSTVKIAKYDFNKDFEGYLSSIAILGSVITLVWYVIVLIFIDYFSKLLNMPPIYIHVMFSYLLTAPALYIVQEKNRVFLKYKRVATISLISIIGSIAFSLLLTIICEDKLAGRIIGQEIVLILINAILWLYIVFKGKSFSFSHCKYALKYATPLLVHLMAGIVLGACDKIAIREMCNPESLAYYSLAFDCCLVIKVLWDSLNQAMVPWLYDRMNEGKIKTIKKVSRYYVLLFLAIAVGVMLISPELLLVFGGNKYSEAIFIMPYLLMGSCFQFVYSMYVNVEFYYKKTIWISIGTAIAALVNIALNYILIGFWGYSGAAIATMISYGVLTTFHYIMVRGIKADSVYDNRYNLLILFVILLITLLMNVLYAYPILRVIAIIIYSVIILGLVYFYKDMLLQIIYQLKTKSSK